MSVKAPRTVKSGKCRPREAGAKVAIRTVTPSSYVVEMVSAAPSEFAQSFFLASDVHWDNAHSDQDLFLKHLAQMRDRDGYWMLNGDFLCLMQGSWDPRKSMSACRPEHKVDDYLDAVIRTAADALAPYADRLLMYAPGNHETAILKRHNSNMVERLVQALKVRNPACKAVAASYANFVTFRVTNPGGHTVGNPVVMYAHHGYGGGGPVTRGTIQTARMAVYLPDAHLVWTGHTHDEWRLPIERWRLSARGFPYSDRAVHFRTAGYKDEFSPQNGWAIERGHPPKPKGGAWLRLFGDRTQAPHSIDSTRWAVRYEVTEAI